jgi:hypothetical protein
MPDLYTVGTDGSLLAHGDYDAGITKEIDRKIRNMPLVVDHCLKKARELLGATGSENFEIVLSTERGAEVFENRSDVTGGTQYLGRKLRYSSGGWGQGIGSSSKGHEESRPRAYVAPSNSKGIHEELSQAVLLKAAMSMSGK